MSWRDLHTVRLWELGPDGMFLVLLVIFKVRLPCCAESPDVSNVYSQVCADCSHWKEQTGHLHIMEGSYLQAPMALGKPTGPGFRPGGCQCACGAHRAVNGPSAVASPVEEADGYSGDLAGLCIWRL